MSVNNYVRRSKLQFLQLVQNKINGLSEAWNCSFVIFVLSVASNNVFSHIQIMVIPGKINISKQFTVKTFLMSSITVKIRRAYLCKPIQVSQMDVGL